MADQKPGTGTIVRADFGAGVDQSMDAWRVPPSQLADLINGRLERVGSVRKRWGYSAVTPPPAAAPDRGDPCGAIASPTQTIVLDRTRDAIIDSEDGILYASQTGQVARHYAPGTTDEWVTRGSVADVIGDVRAWDSSAGEWDDAFDVATSDAGPWVFTLKATRLRKLYGTLTKPTMQLVLSMYDATTGALVDRITETLAQYVYPKLARMESEGTLVVSAVSPNSRVGIDTNTVAATVQLWTVTFTAAGFGAFTSVAPSAAMTDCDWNDLAAFQYSTAERYRPYVPYDMIAMRDAVLVTTYSSRTGLMACTFYTVAGGVATLAAGATFAKVGALPIVAIGSFAIDAGEAAISTVQANLQMALAPPFVTGAARHAVWRISAPGLALLGTSSEPVNLTAPLALLTPGSVHCALTRVVPGSVFITSWAEFVEWDGATANVYGHFLHRLTVDTLGITPNEADTLSSATPSARPFTFNAYGATFNSGQRPVRMPLVLGSSQQAWYGRLPPGLELVTDTGGNYSGNIGTAIVTSWPDLRTSCSSSPAQTVAPRLLPTTGPNVAQLGALYHVPHRQAVDAAGGFAISTIRLATRAPGDALHTAFAASATAVGGIVQTLDGTASGETAIVDRPRIGAIVRSGGGVAVDFTPGDYLVTAIFQYRDAQGCIHRSAPADPYRLTVSGAAQDTWTIYHSAAHYLDRDDAMTEFYVTEPNGTILRRWFTTTASSPPGALRTGVRISVARDGQLGANNANGLPTLDAPTLYTTGGALPFVPVGSARFGLIYRNRLVLGGADDAKSVYYSNEPEAYEAPSFAAGNVIRLEHEAGCTAAGTLNDKLILFSPTGTYAVYGQFRDRFGAGDALSDPESVHDYIGCDQPASAVSLPTGLVFFATDHRFYLLDERLQLVPVGLRVQELTTTEQGGAGFVVCEGAVHIIEEREVRFYMRQAGASPKRTILVYNYQVDQWARDDVAQFGGAGSWGGVCSSRDLGAFVASSSAWANDDRTTYFDNGTTWIKLTAKTAWIQPGGTQDYARVRFCQFLGRSAAPHDLAIRVYTDFDPSTVKAVGAWTAAQLAPIAGTSWPAQVKLQVGSQKTQATQIVIEDAAPVGATTGQGPQLVGLALEVLPLGGVKRLPNTRKR